MPVEIDQLLIRGVGIQLQVVIVGQGMLHQHSPAALLAMGGIDRQVVDLHKSPLAVRLQKKIPGHLPAAAFHQQKTFRSVLQQINDPQRVMPGRIMDTHQLADIAQRGDRAYVVVHFCIFLIKCDCHRDTEHTETDFIQLITSP